MINILTNPINEQLIPILININKVITKLILILVPIELMDPILVPLVPLVPILITVFIFIILIGLVK